MKSKDLVSVIIPSFNHEGYIHDCIESALAQTYQPVEVIVVDDGSTDATPHIARAYAPSVRLIEQTNQGTQAARNTGIRASSGEYIALLDSDDMWLPQKLARQIPILDHAPHVGLVYSMAHRVNSEGSPLFEGASYGRALSDSEPALHQLLVSNPIPTLTAVFRRSCVEEVGFFDERLIGAADRDMWLRIATCWEIAFVPEMLALYREHPLNTTKALRVDKRLGEERWLVLEKAKGYFPVSCDTQPVWNRAYSAYHLLCAEQEALSGNGFAAGGHVSKALTFDPGISHNEEFVPQLAQLLDWCCGEEKTGASYRRFAHQLFSQVPPKCDRGRLKRSTLAMAAMATVFGKYHERDWATIRSVLPVGIQAAPGWLLNRGVWSIAAKAWIRLVVLNRS